VGGTGDIGWRLEQVGAVRSLRELRASGIFDERDYVEQQAAEDYGIAEDQAVWHLTEVALGDLDGEWEDLFDESDDDFSTIVQMERAYRDASPPPPLIAVRYPPGPPRHSPSIKPVDGAHRLTAARRAGVERLQVWLADARDAP
jgi:hypothetical protein